jgi:hypothetical protein
MAVEVTRETPELIAEMGWLGRVVERCTDCNAPTRYWLDDGRIPLCPNCALKREPQKNPSRCETSSGEGLATPHEKEC